MLQRLFVRNFALIRELELELAQGMNILTGETGAGKSLLLGAIGLILGERADPSMVLDPAEKCIVEAEYLPRHPEALNELLAAQGIEPEGDTLIIRRMILPSGKSRAFLNDQPVNLQSLRGLSAQLVELHGQHEGQLLLDPRRQLEMLDRYAGHAAEVERFGKQLQRLRELEREIAALRQREAQATRERDFLAFQVEELEKAQLDPEEYQQLQEELNVLANAEQLKEALQAAYDLLEADELGLNSRLTEVERYAETAASFSRQANEELEKIQQARYLLSEAAAGLQRTAEDAEADPERLQTVENRLNVYNTLVHKYNVRDVSALLATQQELQEKLAGFGQISSNISQLQKKTKTLQAELVEEAARLSEQRLQAAERLAREVQQYLTAVQLPNARFQIDLTPTEANPDRPTVQDSAGNTRYLSPSGWEEANFLISTNPGTPLGPVRKVASGGEISRVMLAMKAALAEKMALPVLIFDEIDTGISGQAALKVGQVMQRLAKNHQLIVITHLPQIASRPGRHYRIYKTVDKGKTLTRVKPLQQDERVTEIAVMMSGEDPSKTAMKSAMELLQSR